MTPLAIIRPEPGASTTATMARELGLEPIVAPLFAVRPLAWEPVAAEDFDAILLGSANALRHGGTALAALRSLPVHAVGAKTAEAARGAGFTVASIGQGGLQSLLPALPAAHRRLLRLSGRERVALDIPRGVAVTLRETYASEPVPMAPDFAQKLTNGAVVLLHSGEAAAHFARECDRLALPRQSIALAALAPRIAMRAGAGWRDLATASAPDDAALLAIAAQLCQGFPAG